jgi:branched-chain amino acid transport system permease protein
MEISEIIASYAIALAILEGLRWGGFKGMTYTLPVFIEGSMSIAGIRWITSGLVVVIGAALVAALVAFHPPHPAGICAQGAWPRTSAPR